MNEKMGRHTAGGRLYLRKTEQKGRKNIQETRV